MYAYIVSQCMLLFVVVVMMVISVPVMVHISLELKYSIAIFSSCVHRIEGFLVTSSFAQIGSVRDKC